MKKIILTTNNIVMTLIAYYTFFVIDGGTKIFTTINWTALIFALVIGGLFTWFHFSILWMAKAEAKGEIEKIEKQYKAYSDSFSSWFIYTSAISKIVQEKIISQMSEDNSSLNVNIIV